MLLRSCATPPARVPTDSSRWLWNNCASSFFRSVMSACVPIMRTAAPESSRSTIFPVDLIHFHSPFAALRRYSIVRGPPSATHRRNSRAIVSRSSG